MKTIALFSLAALSASLALPDAHAGKESRAFIGGLIGGAIIGAALADDDARASVSVSYSSPGYYDWVSVRTWVPGHYSYHHDHCGNAVRVWVTGHYTVVKKRVWVASRPHTHHHHHHYSYQVPDRRDRRDDYRHRDNRRSRRY